MSSILNDQQVDSTGGHIHTLGPIHREGRMQFCIIAREIPCIEVPDYHIATNHGVI